MKRVLAAVFTAVWLLTGCAPLLEREYSTVEPHSSKLWESEAAGTLRAENYQDVVNDLLILIGQHKEEASLRLYNMGESPVVADLLERATVEAQQETALGSYAVEYITFSTQEQRGYYEVALRLVYRRTAEQVQAIVNATSTEALQSLLETALDEGRKELAVRIGYWVADGETRVDEAMAAVRERRGVPEERPWGVLYYPADGPVGMIEFLLDEAVIPAAMLEELLAKAQETEGEEEGEEEGGEGGEEGSEEGEENFEPEA